MIRIVLVDDHPVVREGIRAMLGAEDDFEVVGQASDGAEAVRVVTELRPDLVLMDLRMPGVDGVEATRSILAALPGTRVIVLTTYETDSDILRAVEAGAAGYLLKDIAPQQLTAAVRAAARGETVLAPSAASTLMAQFSSGAAGTRSGPGTPVPQLSDREVEVLRLVAVGSTNAEIGRQLYISETTVKTYLARAFEKLGVSDRTVAAVKAVELGLIETP